MVMIMSWVIAFNNTAFCFCTVTVAMFMIMSGVFTVDSTAFRIIQTSSGLD